MKPKRKEKWFEKYLPFVARGMDAKVAWFLNAFRKNVLTPQEISPYVHLLLMDYNGADEEELKRKLADLGDEAIGRLVQAADIYDAPRLLKLLRAPTVYHAMEALKKTPPPYEREPAVLKDNLFDALYFHSEKLLEQAVQAIVDESADTASLVKAYERYKEILSDRQLLSSLYPKSGGAYRPGNEG